MKEIKSAPKMVKTKAYGLVGTIALFSAMVLVGGTTQVSADETVPEIVSSTVQTTNETVDTTETTVISTVVTGNVTTTTSEVTAQSLETAKSNAEQSGVTVTETSPVEQSSVQDAIADNQKQADVINQTVADYQTAKSEYDAKVEQYNADQVAYDTKVAEKAETDRKNAEAKAKYDEAQAKYNVDLDTYNKAKSEYDKAVVKYDKDKANYDAKVAEKEEADRKNAEAEIKYQTSLANYNVAKQAFDQAMIKYEADVNAYDIAYTNYTNAVAERTRTEIENKQAEAEYQKQLEIYNTAEAKFQKEYEAYQVAYTKYQEDLKAYDEAVKRKAEADKTNAESKAKYESDLNEYNAKKSQYEKDFVEYQTKLAEYQTELVQWQNAKDAYDKYMNDNDYRDLKDVELAQELTFTHEENAVHKITGVSTYLTREAQERLNTSTVFQYNSDALQSGDIVLESPWSSRESEWIVVKTGDKFTVTYDNLEHSSLTFGGTLKEIKRVVYNYEILELPSKDNVGIANVNSDPTVTLTIGASSDEEKPVKVAVDVEFYDENGNQFNLAEHNAIVSLNSLNHWYGAAYVDSGDKPRELMVEAKDADGNTVQGTWNPYGDGSAPEIQNGAVTVKSGYADFGSANVTISADNPIKILIQTVDFVDGEFKVIKTVPSDVTTVNASGGGNGHAIGVDDFTYNGGDDVIGSYTIDTDSGLITFTPKKKFQNVDHQEFVNIGDKKYIAIPNSRVTYDAVTKEVTSVKDNQYIEHGSVFNGESTPTLPGWDNPNSLYLYYGGAGVKMSDGHLVFTANGANAEGAPTVYWFAINSAVGLPKNPGEQPKEPVKPVEPTKPIEPTYTMVDVPVKPTEIEVPVAPEKPTPPTPNVVEVPSEPTKPTPPEKPVEPEKPTKIIVEVPEKPTEPKAPNKPTAPTPPTYTTVEVPNKPVKPTEPEIPSVEWHKNYVVEKVVKEIPEKPKTPEKPITPPTPKTPEKPVTPPMPEKPIKQVEKTSVEKTLPNTGDASSIWTSIAGFSSLISAGLFGFKRKKD